MFAKRFIRIDDWPRWSRDQLLSPNLINEPEAVEHNERFGHSNQPVFWLTANGQAKHPADWYHRVASRLKIPFADAIPVTINDRQSLANLVGPEILSQHHAFLAHKDDKTVTMYVADPFVLKQLWRDMKNRIPDDYERIELFMAPLGTIRQAIAESIYRTSHYRAENQLHVETTHLSSKGVLTPFTRLVTFIGVGVFLLLLYFFPAWVSFLSFLAINVFYFLLNPPKFLMAYLGFIATPHQITRDELNDIPETNYPDYTILVPLKNESAVLPQLLKALKVIEYPPEKLDIKMIAEVTDSETLSAFSQHLSTEPPESATPENAMFHVVKVPVGKLSTKPRSCNYALQFGRGAVCVIYDAEDRPDPLQLKRAYATFLNQKLDTLCVQAKLNYYNARYNLLTRFFSLEYGYWFDVLLPGLDVANIPIPLGGTSNHFLTRVLREIGTWDPYNVTEDADLGWRLSRLGYTTSMVESRTLEEANSRVWSWIKQRTRWQKGFLMTLLVHIRTPMKLWRELGPWGFFNSVLLFATNFFLPVLNPILWFFFIFWYVTPLIGLPRIGFLLPEWLQLVSAVNLFIGNGLYMFAHGLAAVKNREWDLLPLALLIPVYWLLISIASYRALWQIFHDPYSWEKTQHGIALEPDSTTDKTKL